MSRPKLQSKYRRIKIMNIKDILLTVKYGTITRPNQKKVDGKEVITYFDGSAIHIDTKTNDGIKTTRIYNRNDEINPTVIRTTKALNFKDGHYRNCIKEYGNEEMLRLQKPHQVIFSEMSIGVVSQTTLDYEYKGDMLTANVKKVTREISTGIGIENHKEIETYTYTNQESVDLNNLVKNADTYEFRSASRDQYNSNIERAVHEFYDFRTNNVNSHKQTVETKEIAGRTCTVTIENNGKIIDGNELVLD